MAKQMGGGFSIPLVMAGLFGACSHALANGAVAEFSAGGLEFREMAEIAIEREDLFLSQGEVRVRYVFRSTTGEAQDATLGFPMPEVPMSPDDVNYLGGRGPGQIEPKNYMDFEVRVDGSRIVPTLHEYAWISDENVTPLLQAYDIPPFLLPPQLKRLAGLAPEHFIELEQNGLVRRDQHAPDFITPLWNYQAVYEWRQDFSADRTVVEIRYRPLIGYLNDMVGEIIDGAETAEYCVDDAVRAGLRRRLDKQYFEPSTLGYILTTANKWAGPIGEFNLTVSKASPAFAPEDILVAFCPAEARKVSATEFQWSARDFVPKREIRVLFLEFINRGE